MMQSDMSVIKTSSLSKRFGSLLAVDHIDLEIAHGECFGLLGPNGAGKTTLIKMITGVTPPTEGNIEVLGYDLQKNLRQAKSRLGVVPQHDNLDPDLKVGTNLITFARYFDIPAAEARRRSREVLKFFELEEKSSSRVDELSGGMKRRLLIARSLINNPSLIVLDEPTTGLDPHAKYLVWQKLGELKMQGITQIMCTQNMEEAAYLCDRVAIMDHGRFLDLDTPQSLVTKHAGENVWEIWLNRDDRSPIIQGLKQTGLEFREMGGRINIFNLENEAAVSSLLQDPQKLRRRPANLEDVFMKLTGRSLEE